MKQKLNRKIDAKGRLPPEIVYGSGKLAFL